MFTFSPMWFLIFIKFIILKCALIDLRERGRKERERKISKWESEREPHAPRDQVCNLGICPDWNWTGTFWCTGLHWTNQATRAGDPSVIFLNSCFAQIKIYTLHWLFLSCFYVSISSPSLLFLQFIYWRNELFVL